MKHTPTTRRLATACAALSLLLALPAPLCLSRAAETSGALELCHGCCGKHAFYRLDSRTESNGQADPPKRSSAEGTDHFAPDRLIDVDHLHLDLTPDFKKRSIKGIATLAFTPIAEPLRYLRLDAVDLDIKKVEARDVPVAEHHTADAYLGVLFQKDIPPGKKITLTIHYSAEPKDGLYFRTEAMGYLPGDDHFFTQGEPERHRHWFPSYDYPNERFSTEVVCHVPDGMIALSNGRLLSKKHDPKTGLTAFHWRQDKPHVNYLVSVVGGYFEKLEDKLRNIPVGICTQPSDFAEAANSFADTKNIIAFFEKEIGAPFPWDKYYNVVVKDFPFGGMENTSLTTLADRTLFTSASENLHTTRHIDAHEIAHQWFGDLLTCKDWANLWLNEGFATYYTQLYEEHAVGRDAMLYGMYRNARSVLNTKDDKPIVWRGYQHPQEQFDYRSYPKGAWVLHMLRSQLGPDLFRRCVKTYVERNQHRSVVTEDLNRVIEEISGRSFDRFFNQWVYLGGHPELSVKYAWDATAKQARLTVTQTQKRSERVPLFHFPLPVRFITNQGPRDFNVDIEEASEDFYFDLPSAPKLVRIDPDYTLLAKIDFTPPNPLLFAQLDDKDDMIGRLFAVLALGKRKDNTSIEKLAARLNSDPFWGIRVAAAEQLANIHSPEALAALRTGIEQNDARAREAIVKAIAAFYCDDALAGLLDIAASEKNPDIVATAVAALGKFPRTSVAEPIHAAFAQPSYRNRIADAAVDAMRAQDDPHYIASLFQRLRTSEASFTTRDFASALDTLARLARKSGGSNLKERERIRRFLADQLDHPKETVRAAAIKALGTLEDPRSIALLEALPRDSPRKAEAKAAAEALKSLHGEKAPSSELNDLRKEVLDLQKTLGDLKKDFETQKKKAAPEKPAPPAEKSPPPKQTSKKAA